MNIEHNASKSIINKIYLVFRINMSVFKNEIITVKGYNSLANKIMYPIYEDTIVELKGEFRSEGNIVLEKMIQKSEEKILIVQMNLY